MLSSNNAIQQQQQQQQQSSMSVNYQQQNNNQKMQYTPNRPAFMIDNQMQSSKLTWNSKLFLRLSRLSSKLKLKKFWKNLDGDYSNHSPASSHSSGQQPQVYDKIPAVSTKSLLQPLKSFSSTANGCNTAGNQPSSISIPNTPAKYCESKKLLSSRSLNR